VGRRNSADEKERLRWSVGKRRSVRISRLLDLKAVAPRNVTPKPCCISEPCCVSVGNE
jgi:hypothetical protein